MSSLKTLKRIECIAEVKTCSKCKNERPRSEFHSSKRSIDRLQSWCKQCSKDRLRQGDYVYYKCECCSQSFKRRKLSSKAENARSRRCLSCARKATLTSNGGHSWNYNGTEHFAGRQLAAWKASAKRRNHEWLLTKEQLDEKFNEQKGVCALSGVQMEPQTSSPFRPSIDRIDSSRGYTEENFQFVCSCVNVMKNKIAEPEFIRLCGLIAQHALLINSAATHPLQGGVRVGIVDEAEKLAE